MGSFVSRLQSLALALGAPGLFLVTFLDSSFLSLPEIADLLLIWMVIQHKSRMVLYASSAVAGSLAGCMVMYWIGRRGGDALIRSRLGSARAERALAVIRRYGVMAVLIPSILPPPAPFKPFLLLAAFANISAGRFALAILIGRVIRYFGLGMLAVAYGDQATAFFEEHGRTFSLGLAGALAAGLIAYVLWKKAGGGKRR
jgi:membrane protein YqaA with SNARE-associated domain